MASNRGLRKPYQIQEGPQAEQLDAMFEELYRRIATVEAASGGGPHSILSATHDDTTVATPVDGDILIRSGGKWIRKAKGADGQLLKLVTGLPDWADLPAHASTHENGGVDEINVGGLSGVLADPQPAIAHNLLSAQHADTTPASPLRGSLAKGKYANAVDTVRFWLDGLPSQAVAAAADIGSQKYWFDGSPGGVIAGIGDPTWAREPVGPSGSVPVSTGIDWEWQEITTVLVPVGARVYRATDFTLYDRTPTAVVLQTVDSDLPGYWSSGAPTRLTVPANQDGWHAITAQAAVNGTVGGTLETSVYVNGVKRNSLSITLTVGPAGRITGSVTGLASLVVGDYVELYVELTANVVGDSQTIVGGISNTFLELVRL